MNTPIEFFELLAELLKTNGIPFMVAGSVASSFYGNPRATNDVDIIIEPDAESLSAFISSLPRDWYASKEAAESALQHRSMFNVIDSAGGWKADLVLRKERPFSKTEFSRRRVGKIYASEIPVVTAEDSILSKLEWSAASDSQRQYRDALGVASLAAESLDVDYLRRWANELGVSETLEKLLLEARRR